MIWFNSLKGKVKLKEPLNRHTTFRIGGPVSYFIEPKDREDLKLLLSLLKKYKIPSRVIGCGSNLLVADRGLRGALIHLTSREFDFLEFQNEQVKVGSAMRLGKFVQKTARASLSGIEFLAGIPGSVGGAVVMNAGAWGRSISDVLTEVEVMDHSGRIINFLSRQIKFGYRSSNLSDFIILSATFRLVKRNLAEIKKKIRDYLTKRRLTQPSFPSAGCVFKNPLGFSAGYLIENCGLKGLKVGGAQISLRHANFIVNTGNATFSDVFSLIKLIKREVNKKYKINLELEIKVWR